MTLDAEARKRLREEALDCEHRGEPISTHAGDVLQLLDAADAATEVNDRIVTILDEAAGMQPVMSAEEALTQLEAHLHSMRMDIAAATARAEAAEELVEEFQCAALIGDDGDGITPEMVERHVNALMHDLHVATARAEAAESEVARLMERAGRLVGVIETLRDLSSSGSIVRRRASQALIVDSCAESDAIDAARAAKEKP